MQDFEAISLDFGAIIQDFKAILPDIPTFLALMPLDFAKITIAFLFALELLNKVVLSVTSSKESFARQATNASIMVLIVLPGWSRDKANLTDFDGIHLIFTT